MHQRNRMADHLRLSAHHPARATQCQAAIRKDNCSQWPSLAASYMPSVGRSSDSRAFAKQAFSLAEQPAHRCDTRLNCLPGVRCLLQTSNGSIQNALRFLGYSGGAVPDSHRVPCSSAAKNWAADHQRTLTAGNVTRRNRLVKHIDADCCKSHWNAYLRLSAFDSERSAAATSLHCYCPQMAQMIRRCMDREINSHANARRNREK